MKQKQKGAESYVIWRSQAKLTLKAYTGVFLKLLAFQFIISAVWFFKDMWVAGDGIILNIVRPIYTVHQIIQAGQWRFLVTAFYDMWLTLFVVVVIIPFFCILCWFSVRARRTSKKKHLRGAKIVSAKTLRRQMRLRRVKTDLPLGEIHMPKQNEVLSTRIIGRPGSGKTGLILPIIKRLYHREAKSLIWDAKGTLYASMFNQETDKLFNVVDERGLDWRIFNELETEPDFSLLSYSLIPHKEHASDSAMFFDNGARAVFEGGLRYLDINGKRSNDDIWRFFQMPVNDIYEALLLTQGAEEGTKFLAPDQKGSRQADTIATLMQYISALKFMTGMGGDFSTKHWLNDGKPGVLYITSFEDIEHTLRPVNSLLIDLIMKRLLSMSDNLDREIFFILDEFASLNMLPAVVKGLTKARSRGGRIILATQDPFQLKRLYGADGVHVIEDSCGNRVTFSVSGKTAERESQLNIGTAETSSSVRTSSIADENSSSTNIVESINTGPLLLPDELALRKMEGLVKLEGWPFARSRWPKRFWIRYPQIHEPFKLKKRFMLEEIRKKAGAEAKRRRAEKQEREMERATTKVMNELRAKEKIEAKRTEKIVPLKKKKKA